MNVQKTQELFLFTKLSLSLSHAIAVAIAMSFFSVSTQPYGFNNKLFCQRTSILQTMTMNQTHTRQQNCFKKSNLKQKLKYPIPNYVTQIMLKLKKIKSQSNLKIPNSKSLLSNKTTSKLIYGTSTLCKTILQQLILRTTSLQEQGTSENRQIERIEKGILETTSIKFLPYPYISPQSNTPQ